MSELSITRGRRYISKAEKVGIVEETYASQRSIAEIAHSVNSQGTLRL